MTWKYLVRIDRYKIQYEALLKMGEVEVLSWSMTSETKQNIRLNYKKISDWCKDNFEEDFKLMHDGNQKQTRLNSFQISLF